MLKDAFCHARHDMLLTNHRSLTQIIMIAGITLRRVAGCSEICSVSLGAQQSEMYFSILMSSLTRLV